MSLETVSKPDAKSRSLAERIASLSPEQRALYERRRKEIQAREAPQEPRIARQKGAGPWPATTDQTALWFFQQLDPGTSAYNIGNGFRLIGDLEVEVLHRALQAVVRRHEILRTTFRAASDADGGDGKLHQVVHEWLAPDFQVLDARSAEDPMAEALARVAEWIKIPFDLGKGPLVRVLVAKIAPRDHGLVVVLHHIVTDWWSYHLFYTELFSLYRAFSEGRPDPLAPLPVQFKDWAVWRERWMESEEFQRQEAYWLRQLAGVPTVLELVGDRPRPPVQSHQGAREFFRLDAGLTRRLRAMNRRAGTSSFMTLLAAAQVLIWRYTGQADFLMGTPVSADRELEETVHLIGYLLNTVVLRADLTGQPSFRGLLERVRTTCLDAFAHKELPFRHLVERIKPERDMSRMPLYQVEYLYISTDNPVGKNPTATGQAPELPDFEISTFFIDRKTSPVDLQVTFTEGTEEVYSLIEYNTDIFEAATVRRLGERFLVLLDGLLELPELPISAVPLLSPTERRQVLEAWNADRYPPAPAERLHEAFLRQAEQTPEAVALTVFAGSEAPFDLRYAELRERAGAVAQVLQSAGIGAEDVVGLATPRTGALLAGLLGVLEAGAAYLPLDPSYPAARLAFMLEDSGARALILQSALEVPGDFSGPVIVLDAQGFLVETRGFETVATPPMAAQGAGEGAAYLIYTSGSTGRPKGVVVSHRSAVNYFHWLGLELADAELRCVVASTSLSFDISTIEIYPALARGGRIVLVENLLHLAQVDRAALGAAAPAMINTVPSAMKGLLDLGGLPASVETVLLGGEAVSRELVEEVYRRGRVRRIVDVYGPTEATVYSLFEELLPGDGSPVLIGRPIASTQGYVVDPWLHPLPPGVPGELLLGGAGIARGYHRRPGLTAQRFLPDPFASVAGSRLYRTGDLARQREDGRFEYLGRLDQQVKLRGFRIELGEIETALRALPGIRDAVAQVRAGGDLAAYLIAESAADPESLRQGLKETLAQRLPHYMVPGSFTFLADLPKTPNGKLDRKALPAPEAAAEASASAPYRPPTTPSQRLLAQVWAGVLGVDVERISADGHFFDLGGHSLKATQVVSRLRQGRGVELPVRILFERPTLAALAAYLDELGVEDAAAATPPIERLPRPGGLPPAGLPLSFAQQRLWFLDQLEGPSPTYNMSAALELRGRLDVEALRRSLTEIVRRHEALRTIFPARDGRPYQVVRPAAPFELPVVATEDPRPLAVAEMVRPFDLASDPLLRALLLRRDEAWAVLVLTMHHIVSDGWSVGVLVQELSKLYAAFSQGQPSPLPELPVQTLDFSVWQRRWLGDEVLARQLAYWRQRLADAPARLELPWDRPRPAMQSYRGGSWVFTVDAPTTGRLKAVGGHEGATLFMTLLAGFGALLARQSGQRDLVAGSPVAGRSREETEGLIGFFVNTLPLRLDVGAGPSGRLAFLELLGRVRQRALEAFAHPDVPFEHLVEALQPERQLGQTPLFQVSFALQNAPFSEPLLPGLELGAFEVENTVAKFDLTLLVQEAPLPGGGTGLLAALEYNRDLFDRTTVARWADQLVRLFEAVALRPSVVLEAVDLLSLAQRHQLLSEWQDVSGSGPFLSLPALVARQAEIRPEAVAVRMGAESLSYAQLWARVRSLASGLVGLGVSAEVVVGVHLARSPELVVSLLAVLEAGGAFLPLDPALPVARLARMVADSGACLVVGEAQPGLDLPADCRWVALDSLAAAESSAGARPAVLPSQLAYVLYTSGSTGDPKGVMVSHAGMVNYLGWAASAYLGPLGISSSVADGGSLVHTSVGFDLTLTALFVPLLEGRPVVLVPEAAGLDGLASEVRRCQAAGVVLDFLKLTPSHARMLAGQLEASELAGVARGLVLGGEALLGADLAGWRAAAPETWVWNEYGPTETVVGCVVEGAPAGDLGAGAMAIGRPVAGARAVVLDGGMRPLPLGVLPLGVPGELFLGGTGVARGYLGKARETAKRFVPEPFGGEPGGRLYRTGDRVRLLADGRLEFLGRVDGQLKVRGHRVEPGEIEAALAAHPVVRQAVVAVRSEAGTEGVPSAGEVTGWWTPRRDSAEWQARLEGWRRRQVERWQAVYAETYGGAAASSEQAPADWDLVGWESSFTGQALPATEMRAWVAATVDRLLALRPRRVMEIGCGTGLLLRQVAGHCEHYVGTDFSPEVLARLGGEVERLGLAGVELLCRPAADFSGLEPRSFDLVVLNSVVQYFSDAGYLLEVLEGALELVTDGGHVFLGDVRSLPLLEAQHAAVLVARAEDATAVVDLRRRLPQAVAQEEELVLDPRLFHSLARRHSRLSAVRVEPKPGGCRNELYLFRHDVTLSVGPPAGSGDEVSVTASPTSADEVRALLMAAPSSLYLRELADPRLAGAFVALAALRPGRQGGGETAAALRRRVLDAEKSAAGITPDGLWALASEFGYQAELRASTRRDGRYDALLWRQARPRVPLETGGGPEDFANHPLDREANRELTPELRRHLEARLPLPLVPSAFVLLPALPLTANGKVDRKALPEPAALRSARVDESMPAAPASAAEELLAALWCEVLELPRVGLDEDFFDLGGHSLLATQVVSRIRQTFEVELPVRRVFEAPTVRRLAAVVAAARAGGEALPPSPPLVPRGSEEAAGEQPLSFAQQRLWFLDQLEGPNPTYNMAAALRLEGRLDVAALAGALAGVVRRHEALRTSFPKVEGRAVQRVSPAAAVRAAELLPMADLSRLEGDLLEAEIRRLGSREVTASFDLARDAMLRARLLRRGRHSHVLLVTMHHIASDGWSLGLLTRELSELYRAAVSGEAPRLPELPVQYGDFARWQRGWLRGEVLAAQLDFWRRRLAGSPELLELPVDWPRPAMQTFHGGTLPCHLSGALSRQVESLGRSQGATPYMVLLAAWGLVLARLAGQRDVVVGTPIAGRNRREIEPLIGFFVNTLCLRLELDAAGPGESFEALLRRVRGVALDAYAHQDLPFEKLVEELQPERSLRHSALFQVLFSLQNVPGDGLRLPGLTLQPVELESTTSKFDLSLYLAPGGGEEGGGIGGFFEYNRDLFDEVTVARLGGYLRSVLEAAIADPGRAALALPLLSEAECHELVVGWNEASRRQWPRQTDSASFLERFAANAERDGERPAVTSADGEATLSYGQLLLRAGRLARALRRRGVGPDVPVAFALERTPDLATAVLGILAAGGAYVPLDPEHPAERLAFVLADARPAVLLTEAGLLDGDLPEGTQVVFLRELLAEEGGEPEVVAREFRHAGGARPANLAYLLYTSGSTGRPKGVEIPRGALDNLLRDLEKRMDLGPETVLLAVTTPAFDIATLELLAPLWAGGRLVVTGRRDAADGARLAELLHRHGANFLQATPTSWRLLLAAGWDAQGDQGRQRLDLLSGGEALPVELARRLVGDPAVTPGRRMWSFYGPTETTIYCGGGLLSHALLDAGSSGAAPIGRTFTGTRYYVLDDDLELVPPGVGGELYIGGTCQARGYRAGEAGRAALTAERFLPDPYSGLPGERLYKSGDRVRLRGDGQPEFLGRTDFQVKLRGFRIELGEIEAALRRHPAVETTLVTLDPGGTEAEARLIAYLVADPAYRPGGETADAEAGPPADGDLEGTWVDRWQGVWDATYRDEGLATEEAVEDDLNTVGWNDSYTGEPIPRDAMREWAEATVERILARQPRRVLEVGCGTGMLLLRLLPHLEHFTGLDLSAGALAYVRRQLERRPDVAGRVQLHHAPAHHLGRLVEDAPVDAVVLNSVVQYFPSVEYLAEVLAAAIERVAPGGFVFVGDVRSLPLAEDLAATVELGLADDDLPLQELRRRIRRRLGRERELLLAPDFFRALAQRHPRLRAATVQLKKGHHLHELTRFRYDVWLHVAGEAAGEPAGAPAAQSPGSAATAEEIRGHLSAERPERWTLQGLPNRRLAPERALRRLLGEFGEATAGDLRRAWQAAEGEEPGLDPEDLWALAEDLPYAVFLEESAERPGCFDATFERFEGGGSGAVAAIPAPAGPLPERPWTAYANQPLREEQGRLLVPELRRHLRRSLPEYMVPGAFVLLEDFPTTPNGKVDRKALPAPEGAAVTTARGHRLPPRDNLELQLAQIFQDVLGGGPVGAGEDFFDLGGHSLLAVQLMDRIQRTFGQDLPLATLFEHGTVEALARRLKVEAAGAPWSPLVALRASRAEAPGQRPPLFCAHPAGGHVLCYADLARELGSAQPFYGLQAPGADEGQTPLGSVEAMATLYREAILEARPEGPLLITGWSLGGQIAFELGRQLEAAGRRPALLAILDGYPDEAYPEGAHEHLQEDAVLYVKMLGGQTELTEDDLRPLDPDAMLDKVLDTARRHGLLPPDVPASQVKRLLELFKVNTRLGYRPKPYGGDVVLLHTAKHEGIETRTLIDAWRPHVGGRLETHLVPGEHETMTLPPHVETLARQLEAAVERALAASGRGG